MNRNHYFLLGLVLFFLGVEFRLVDSLTLSGEVTGFLARQPATRLPPSAPSRSRSRPTTSRFFTKSVRPPEWLRLVAPLDRQRADPPQLGHAQARRVATPPHVG